MRNDPNKYTQKYKSFLTQWLWKRHIYTVRMVLWNVFFSVDLFAAYAMAHTQTHAHSIQKSM